VIDPGPYLSYAIQWILFALFSFTALGWALRQERRARDAEDPEEIARAAERDRRASLRDPTDSQIEDEQLGVGQSSMGPADPTAVGAIIHDRDLRERLTARYGTAIVPRVKTQRTRRSSPGSADDANPDDADHDAADTLIDAG
jgi:hypothetical protein